MEISARVYVIANGPELLKETCELLKAETRVSHADADAIEPNAILPLAGSPVGLRAAFAKKRRGVRSVLEPGRAERLLRVRLCDRLGQRRFGLDVFTVQL